MKSRKLLVNDIPVHYVSSHALSNDAIVLLHWRWDSSSTFAAIMKQMEEDWHSFVAFDFPWFGKSGMPSWDWTINDYIAFTKDFLHKIWVTKISTAIGHSFWCRVLIKAIASWELNTDALIMVWAWGIQENNNRRYYPLLWMGKKILTVLWLHTVRDTIQSKIRSQDYQHSWVMSEVFLHTIWEDLTNHLENVSTNTLLIRGSEDDQTPVAHGELMNNKIKNSTLHTLEWWSHFVHQEYPDRVYMLISEFWLN